MRMLRGHHRLPRSVLLPGYAVLILWQAGLGEFMQACKQSGPLCTLGVDSRCLHAAGMLQLACPVVGSRSRCVMRLYYLTCSTRLQSANYRSPCVLDSSSCVTAVCCLLPLCVHCYGGQGCQFSPPGAQHIIHVGVFAVGVDLWDCVTVVTAGLKTAVLIRNKNALTTASVAPQ